MANQKQSDRFYVGGTASVAVPEILGKAQHANGGASAGTQAPGYIIASLTVEKSGTYIVKANATLGEGQATRNSGVGIYVNGVSQSMEAFDAISADVASTEYSNATRVAELTLSAGEVLETRLLGDFSIFVLNGSITIEPKANGEVLVGTTKEATATESGLVKLNEFNSFTVPNYTGGSVYNVNTAEILEVGELYRIYTEIELERDTLSAAYIRFTIYNNNTAAGQIIAKASLDNNAASASRENIRFMASGGAVFTATTTRMNIRIDGVADTFARDMTVHIEKLNNYANNPALDAGL